MLRLTLLAAATVEVILEGRECRADAGGGDGGVSGGVETSARLVLDAASSPNVSDGVEGLAELGALGSTIDQNPELQLDALKAAGCEKVFVEKASGAQRDRPELASAISYARQGDTIVVWKLDRLARSMKQLVETIEDLDGRKIGFRSLTEAIDTTTAGGKLVFHIFGALAEFERAIIFVRDLHELALKLRQHFWSRLLDATRGRHGFPRALRQALQEAGVG